ncbi:MAG: hypothetical protein V4506_15125 [Bacteroidota bacterium]
MYTGHSKIKTGFDILVLVIFTCCILYPILFLISNYYEQVVGVIFEKAPRKYLNAALANGTLKTVFKFSKIGLFVALIWLAAFWLDYFTTKKKALTSFLINRVSSTLYSSFYSNKTFFSTLNKEVRVAFSLILIIFFVAECMLLISMPTSYDELFSYSVFSGKGIWTSLSYYPVPNNHVLYNLMTSLFVKLPIDIEISTRIPAFLAALFTVYYFFKLSHEQLGGKIAIALTLFIACLYPFQLFSISARGYAFVNLCCVLLLYSTVKLISADHTSKKYHWLFRLSGFAGIFAVPSFLYVLFAVYIVYFLFVLRLKQKTALVLFFKDCFICGGLIILGYIFIYLLNEQGDLTNPNGGATKFSLSDPNLVSIITSHIKDLSDYLFFNYYTLFILYIITAIGLGYGLMTKKINSVFLAVLSFFMILSPLLILPLHRVLPFQRNWLYLIFPAALCLGFLLQLLSVLLANSFSRLARFELDKKLFFVLLAAFIFSLAKFDTKHHFDSRIDYEIATVRQEYINAEARNISSIAMTGKGFEYYPAEFIRFLCYKYDPQRAVSLAQLDTITNQDILVIDNSEEQRFKPQLSNYRVLRYFDENLTVYCRNKP